MDLCSGQNYQGSFHLRYKDPGEYRRHYITKDLPKDAYWSPFLTALELANDSSSLETGQPIADLKKNLLIYETRLRREKGIDPGATLYVRHPQESEAVFSKI